MIIDQELDRKIATTKENEVRVMKRERVAQHCVPDAS